MNRTRVRDTRSTVRPVGTYVQTTNTEATHSCVTEEAQDVSLSFEYPVGDFQQTSDVVIPGFAKRSARGEIFNNVFTSYKSRADVPSLSTLSYYVPYAPSFSSAHKHCTYHTAQVMTNCVNGLNQFGSPVGHLGGDPSVSANLTNLACTQAAANIDTPIFDSSVFVAELRETIGFLRNPVRSLIEGLDKARRAKRSGRRSDQGKALFEFLRDNWMSYRYAVRPLVLDVQSAAEAVADTVLNHRPERRTARGGASDSAVYTSESSSGLYDQFTETRVDYSVRAGVLYEYERSPNTFGVGLLRVPLAAWEAIPGSFIVDWAFNIGSFIEAITPVGGIKRLASWTTKDIKRETTREIWWARGGVYPGNGQTRVITSDGKSTEKLFSETKTRVPGLSVGLAHSVMPFKADLERDIARTVDLVAIASQLLRSV